MLISTLEPKESLQLLGQPLSYARDPERLSRAYALFYDKRGGAIEIEVKEDQQGFGMNKRHKKSEVRDMLMLLSVLAHNVLVWAGSWLAEETPQWSRYDTLRMVRDLMSISGLIELDQKSKVLCIILNRAAGLAQGLLSALRLLLLQEDVVIILDKI